MDNAGLIKRTEEAAYQYPPYKSTPNRSRDLRDELLISHRAFRNFRKELAELYYAKWGLKQVGGSAEEGTGQRSLPDFRDLTGHDEQPEGHASGVLPKGFQNPASLEDAASRMDVSATHPVPRTKKSPKYMEHRIESGHEEQESSKISQAVLKSLNKLMASVRFTIGSDIGHTNKTQYGVDARRELRHESQTHSRSQVQQASSPIYLPSKATRKDDFSSSQVKRFPQVTWSLYPHSQSNQSSVDSGAVVNNLWPRAAAYHTSANRRCSTAAAAATAALETTDTSKANEDDQVGGTGAMNKHQVRSPLGYHISSDTMRKSMLASRSSRSAYWQYTLYEGPKKEKVKVHYCKSLETSERISKLFLNESVIGFDIEWKPAATVKDGIRKNVATIQLATEERIALFHVARFSKGDKVEDLVAPSFKQIMESPSITKVGVSVKSDCTRLRKFMNIDSRGLFELSHLYKLVRFASDDVRKINKKLVSLATQVEEHLMLPMYKDDNVRASDWSEELNYEQIYCELAPHI
ncbi:MAG: hypothetical protein Q9211_006206 [Gyalolechia sp. 1 TL-2023]